MKRVTAAATGITLLSAAFIGSGATSAQAGPNTTDVIATVAAAQGIDARPGRGGWRKIGKGVFVNTKIGNPDLIAKAGNARNGRNVGLRVTENVTVHRILGNGNWNLIDISEDDKAVIPGTRVHDRGALMFLSTTQTDRAKTTNQGAWVYIDTDARINNRNRLITGSALIENSVRLTVVNSTDRTYRLELKDYNGPFAPGQSVTRLGASSLLWTDDIKGRLIRDDGATFYIGARTPNVGRDSITVGQLKHQFASTISLFGEAGEVCYYSPVNGTYLLGSMALHPANRESGYIRDMTLEIVSGPGNYAKCTNNF